MPASALLWQVTTELFLFVHLLYFLLRCATCRVNKSDSMRVCVRPACPLALFLLSSSSRCHSSVQRGCVLTFVVSFNTPSRGNKRHSCGMHGTGGHCAPLTKGTLSECACLRAFKHPRKCVRVAPTLLACFPYHTIFPFSIFPLSARCALQTMPCVAAQRLSSSVVQSSPNLRGYGLLRTPRFLLACVDALAPRLHKVGQREDVGEGCGGAQACA